MAAKLALKIWRCRTSYSVTIGNAESVGNDNALRIRVWDASGAPADASLRIAVFNP